MEDNREDNRLEYGVDDHLQVEDPLQTIDHSRIENQQQEDANLTAKRLTWVEIVLVIAGIVVLYVAVNLLTLVAFKIWPHEMVVIYINGLLTQIFMVLLILGIKKLRKLDWQDLGFRRYQGKAWRAILAAYGLTMLFNIMYTIYMFSHGIETPDNDVYSKILLNATWLSYILNLIITVGIAPVVEETVFRGLLFGGLRTYFGKWTAAGISALIFSGLHLQLYGFVPRFAIGIALVYLYQRFNSLYPSIMMHAINNFIAVSLGAMLSFQELQMLIF